MTSRSKRKTWWEEVNSSFPPDFNEWFDEQWPHQHWNNAPSQWLMMKRVAYSAYVKGKNECL